MIAPRASGAFVCLRCELTTARPRAPFLHARRHPNASFSASTARRHGVDNSAEDDPFASIRAEDAKADAQPEDHAAETEATETEDWDTSASKKHEPARKTTASPMGKVMRRHNKLLRETRADLEGIQVLGSDAHILVLSELKDDQESRRQKEIAAAEAASRQPARSISEILEAEAASSGPDETQHHLDSLRPASGEYDDKPHLTKAAYRKLSTTLTKGFSGQQLSRYYATAKNVEQSHVKQTILDQLKQRKSKSTGKRPVERTPWQPGTASREVQTAKALKKAAPPSKRVLVDQILRNIWGVVVLEEIESVGEIDMALKPWQIALLNASATSNALDRVGTLRKARLEVSSDGIRITAVKTNAEYAADDIEELLKYTEVHRFSIAPWASALDQARIPQNKIGNLFPRDILQEVGSSTGTVPEVVSDDTILIRSLDKASAEEAKRCFINMLPFSTDSSKAKQTMDSSIMESEKKKQMYLAPHIFRSSLPLAHRTRDLGRWTLPVSEAEDNPFSEHHDPLKDHSKQIIETLHAVEDSPTPSLRGTRDAAETRSDAKWAEYEEDATAVEFGQVLFPMRHKEPSDLSIFSSTVPGLTKIFTDYTLNVRSRFFQETLEYGFVPLPLEGVELEAGQQLPDLSLRFELKDDKPALNNVNLGFSSLRHRVLLPGQATDLEFKQYKRLRLKTPLADPNIRAFAEAVCENIESGGRLSAPDSLIINVPNWTIPGHSRDDLQSRPVTYLFTGVKHKQSLNTSFDGHALSFSVAHEGKLGARAGKLTLYGPSRSRQNPLPSAKARERLETFVGKTSKLVNRLTELATDKNDVAQTGKKFVETINRRDSKERDGRVGPRVPRDAFSRGQIPFEKFAGKVAGGKGNKGPPPSPSEMLAELARSQRKLESFSWTVGATLTTPSSGGVRGATKAAVERVAEPLDPRFDLDPSIENMLSEEPASETAVRDDEFNASGFQAYPEPSITEAEAEAFEENEAGAEEKEKEKAYGN